MKIILLNWILLILSTECQDCSFLNKANRNNQWLLIKDFYQFNELNFECSKILNISVLELRPNTKLILDASLKVNNLTIQPPRGSEFSITLSQLKGLDLKANPFLNISWINYSPTGIFWSISNSDFEFYLDDQKLITECDESFLIRNKQFFVQNLMTKMRVLLIQATVKFPQETCPIAFNNAQINFFQFKKLSSSLIRKNMLKFKQLNLSDQFDCFIFQLSVEIYRTDLSFDLLDKNVFKNLLVLDLNGVISSIQIDLFKSFNRLKLLRIRTQNIRNIFVNNNKWIGNLNSNVNINLLDLETYSRNLYKSLILVIYQSFENINYYNYPDEDICNFKNFPHEQLVLPELKPTDKSHCTCTELFLIRYSIKCRPLIEFYVDGANSNYNYVQYYYDEIYNHNISKCWNASTLTISNRCHLDKRLLKCKVESILNTRAKSEKFYFYIYDWYELANSSTFLFVYFNMIFSLIGITLNLLMIIVLSSGKLKDKMYFYLRINSYFNLIYIIILASRLVSANFNYEEQIRSFRSLFEQYFSILIVKLGSNIAKSCSNIAYISFTLSRYVTVTDKKNFISKYFYKISKRKYLFLIIGFSFLINVYICFEFSVQEGDANINQLQHFNLKNYTSLKSESNDDYKERFTQSEYLILTLLQYIKIIFSDLSYGVISAIVDIILFIYVREKMKLKKNITNVVASMIISSIRGENYLKKPKKKIAKLSDSRVYQMVICNTINFVFFRLPLAIISFYGFIFRYDKTSMKYQPDLASYIICKFLRFCIALEGILFCFYLNSFIVQFCIFLKLDKNFNFSFHHMIRRFYQKLLKITKFN